MYLSKDFYAINLGKLGDIKNFVLITWQNLHQYILQVKLRKLTQKTLNCQNSLS